MSRELVKEQAPSAMPNLVIVEDEAIVCKLLERAFSGEYKLSIFESAEAYQEGFDPKTPHVLLTDKNLPGITGIELVEQQRQVTDNFEAVLVTGYADIDSVILSMDLGIFSYMRKPFEIQELKHTVSSALTRLTHRLHRQEVLEQAQVKLAEYAREIEQSAAQPAAKTDQTRIDLAPLARGLHEIKDSLAQVTASPLPDPKGS